MKFLRYFLIVPLFLNAELVIEITKGSDNPYRIALIPFQGESDASKQANEIVKNDLIRTGEFYIFDENSQYVAQNDGLAETDRMSNILIFFIKFAKS